MARRSIKPKARKVPLPSAALKLDWREYFAGFMEEHGEPMDWNGRLIFPDGWAYSATDYAGPEWPPPSDPKELRTILTAYWTLRLEEVTRQLRQLQLMLDDLLELRRNKSAPLKRKLVASRKKLRDGSFAVKHKVDEPDYDQYKLRMEFLYQDRADCKAKLKELKNGVPEVQAVERGERTPRGGSQPVRSGGS